VAGHGGDARCRLAGRVDEEGPARGRFLWFIASNLLWIAWGWHTHAWALIALQVGLFVLNVRGAKKNET
jgi:hypothetical protein